MIWIVLGLVAASLATCLVLYKLIISRNLQYWLPAYLKQCLRTRSDTKDDIHVYVCVADHWEPYLGGVSKEKAHERVARWISAYPKIASKYVDSYGRSPQHSYFYPEEEYDEWVLDQLSHLCRQGYGDVEIHLHHDNDNAENLHKTLTNFKTLLHEKHGLLRKNEHGEIIYGFIHGNWALDNSRPDGKWCGVDNEIQVLLDTGCVFDMTMPSAPSDTQTSTINSIYLAREDGCCKSHDKGERLSTETRIQPDQLLMIQGPLCFDWGNRKHGILPRIEAAELSMDAPPTEDRTRLWESCRIGVEGAENHLFIKLHCHGLEDSASDMFFDQGGFETLWNSLEMAFKDRNGYKLHYVTAYEMYQKVVSLTPQQAHRQQQVA